MSIEKTKKAIEAYDSAKKSCMQHLISFTNDTDLPVSERIKAATALLPYLYRKQPVAPIPADEASNTPVSIVVSYK